MRHHSKHSRRLSDHGAVGIESDTSTLVGSIDEDACHWGNTRQWDGNTQELYGIAHGSAGMVWAVDEYTIVKVYLGRDRRSIGNSDTERQAYRNLAKNGPAHDHVLMCYNVNNKHGLLLERCRETVRQRLKSPEYSAEKEALHLSIQATRGLEVIHRCGIIQGDVGCHNMLIGYDEKLKIADFAGSSVVGSKYTSSVDYEVGSKLPGSQEPTERSDIFALGSAIYEMITRQRPYYDLHYTEIQKKFKRGIFPDDFGDCYELKPIVEKCWGKGGRSFYTAAQVLDALYDLDPSSRTPLTLRAPKESIHHTRMKNHQTTVSRESPQEIARSHPRKSRPEHGIYVSSHRTEKRTGKSQRTPRSQRYETSVGNNTLKRHRTHENGALNSIVHMVQVLKLSVHTRPLSSKKRDRY